MRQVAAESTLELLDDREGRAFVQRRASVKDGARLPILPECLDIREWAERLWRLAVAMDAHDDLPGVVRGRLDAELGAPAASRGMVVLDELAQSLIRQDAPPLTPKPMRGSGVDRRRKPESQRVVGVNVMVVNWRVPFVRHYVLGRRDAAAVTDRDGVLPAAHGIP